MEKRNCFVTRWRTGDVLLVTFPVTRPGALQLGCSFSNSPATQTEPPSFGSSLNKSIIVLQELEGPHSEVELQQARV